jgi:5-formyltetrahydrofolate cyclo-ligase
VSPPESDAKVVARKAAAARRRAIHDAPDRAARNARATAHLRGLLDPLGPVAISGYLPIRSEIDPRPAMTAHPGPVGVPVILGPGQALAFRLWTPDAALVPGPFGALVPETGAALVPQVLIVPLLAWDRLGFRLGYGGGFYDRTLAALRATGPVLAVGLAFAGQETGAVPIDRFDQRLDALVNEDGVLRFD